jgi:hypothetical protein
MRKIIKAAVVVLVVSVVGALIGASPATVSLTINNLLSKK